MCAIGEDIVPEDSNPVLDAKWLPKTEPREARGILACRSQSNYLGSAHVKVDQAHYSAFVPYVFRLLITKLVVSGQPFLASSLLEVHERLKPTTRLTKQRIAGSIAVLVAANSLFYL